MGWKELYTDCRCHESKKGIDEQEMEMNHKETGSRLEAYWVGCFLSSKLIFHPKSSIIGRKERMLDERNANEII